MKQMVRSLCIAAVGLTCLGRTSAGEGPADLKKLQGVWRLVHEIEDGNEKTANEIADIHLTFAADGTWKVQKAGELVGGGTMTMDATKKPKTVDYAFTSGDLKGKGFTAIYEIEGSTFRQCGVLEGARPTEFTAKAGSKRFLATFRKVLGAAPTAGRYFELTYPPSDQPGELAMGVTYAIWLPPHVKTIRGVIVHQHGCGVGACSGGATAAYDLHWQALAKKWDCALLGPSYHQAEGQNCRLWCDPRNGSDKTFRKALADFAAQSQHPELATAPWCLWGHSGGGFWASLMQTMHPERIVAIWFRSGTAFATWEKGEIPRPTIPAAAYDIPIMLNPGAKENGDKRFQGAWTGSMAMFQAYRAKGAPAGFAPDPRTAHECGDSRYLAIPFFDACLAMRLPHPKNGDLKLKAVDPKTAWLAEPLGDHAQPTATFASKTKDSVWLPNEAVAKAWAEYVKTGATSDVTPPPAPTNVKAKRLTDGSVEIVWEAEADFESGLRGFIVERDGKDLATIPRKSQVRFGRPLFQAMSYHDTPEAPLPALRFIDKGAPVEGRRDYRVIAVNSVGLKSAATKATHAP